MSGEKMIEEMTKDENKRVKDRLMSLIFTQSVVCALIILFSFALKLIGGDLYEWEKGVYISDFEDKTSVKEVLSQLSTAVTSSNSADEKEKPTPPETKSDNTLEYAVLSEDDGADAVIDFKEVQTLSSVKIAKLNMVMPLSKYRVTSEYGYRVNPVSGLYKLHSGVDLGANSGEKIYSALDGKVVRSDYASDYGHFVMVDHGDGLCTLYAHCSERLVSVGDTVKQGDVIALVGSTGASTGPHLHFEVRVNNERINPLNVLPDVYTA